MTSPGMMTDKEGRISAVWSAVWVASMSVVLSVAVKVLSSRLRGLRLTDWLGLTACAAGIVAVPSLLWEQSPWFLLVLPPVVVGGLMASRRTVSAWRRGETVEGLFVLGSVPDGVRNRWWSAGERRTPTR